MTRFSLENGESLFTKNAFSCKIGLVTLKKELDDESRI